MLKQFREASIVDKAKAILYLSLAGLVVMIGMLVNDSRAAVKVVYGVPAQIHNELQATRDLTDRQANDLRIQVLAKITEVQTKLSDDVGKLSSKADYRMGKLETDSFSTLNTLSANINTQLTTLNTNVNSQLTTANGSVGTLATAYGDVPKVLGARFDYFTDCQANGLCWQNALSDNMLAFRASSRDLSVAMQGISSTLPTIASNIQAGTDTFKNGFPAIVKNTTDITHNIEVLTHPKWYWRLLGAVAQGSTVYFNVRPVTSLIQAK